MITHQRSGTSRRDVLRLAAAGALLAPGLAMSTEDTAAAETRGDGDWVAAWTAATVPPIPHWVADGRGFADQTLRQLVYATAGGQAVRIRVGNTYGTAPLTIGRAGVGIALRANGADVIAGTSRPVTFSGAATVTIPPGEQALSDEVALTVQPHQVLAVDLYLPESSGAPEFSSNPIQAPYLADGDRAGTEPGDGFGRVTMPDLDQVDVLPNAAKADGRPSFYVTGVDVRQSRGAGCVVVAGDSLTFGRWPQWLSRRLAAEFGDRAPNVVQVANSGQKLVSDSVSAPSLPARFDADVLSQPGITHAVVSIGFNDLAIPSRSALEALFDGAPPQAPDDVTAEQMIGCYEELIARAHAAGVPITGCTVTPGNTGAWNVGSYATTWLLREDPGHVKDLMVELWPEKTENVRRTVNRWIRESGAFDDVFDFAGVLANRLDRSVKDPMYTDDGVHVNTGAWYEMAYAVDVAKLARW